MVVVLLWLPALPSAAASAKSLSDGFTASVSAGMRPGVAEVMGQQNLHPRVAGLKVRAIEPLR